MNTTISLDDPMLELETAWEQARAAAVPAAKASERLAKIRVLSNIIAAVENLITQCEGHSDYLALRAACMEEHQNLKDRMKHLIHSD